MRVEILRKKLTATELGVAGTNDWYIDIPQDVKDIVKEYKTSDMISFIDKTSKKEYILRMFRKTDGSQIWIKLFNQYKKDKEINCADEIILEKNIDADGNIQFYIDVMKYEKRFELEYIKKQKKFQTYNYVQDNLDELIKTNKINILDCNGEEVPLNIIKVGSYKKRRDAAKENNLYTIDNIDKIIKEYKYEDVIIQLKDRGKKLYEVFNSVKYTYTKIEY